ncbi:hypothetical protein DV735_g5053, partial [Chaetothyriales sp. CBS 134920]
MKFSLPIAALLAASIPNLLTLADNCIKSPEGNSYCEPVKSILFANFGQPGIYNRVTGMDGSSGACSSVPQPFSGGMAPLDQEVSWHFRGPMHLKQFAFYAPAAITERDTRGHRHSLLHQHRRLGPEVGKGGNVEKVEKVEKVENEKRAVGDMVTATINGQVVSWVNQYSGDTSSPAADASQANPNDSSPPMVTATINGQVVSWVNEYSGGDNGNTAIGTSSDASTSPTAAVAQTSPSYSTAPAPSGAWVRQSYYSAANGTAENLVFLNNMGGAISGTVDEQFGASLSYASADGLTAASGPTILSDIQLGDGTEVALFSSQKCSGGDCGFYRPGTVAYHGFGGASKLFLLEFDMPYTGSTGFNKDMPAVWMLNALIPRTLQYGTAECSCWETGCGEWDIFEVLESGRSEMIATFHGDDSIGESDYFARPGSGETMKAMVIMDGDSRGGRIVVLDAETEFDLFLDSDRVKDMMATDSAATRVAVLSK